MQAWKDPANSAPASLDLHQLFRLRVQATALFTELLVLMTAMETRLETESCIDVFDAPYGVLMRTGTHFSDTVLGILTCLMDAVGEGMHMASYLYASRLYATGNEPMASFISRHSSYCGMVSSAHECNRQRVAIETAAARSASMTRNPAALEAFQKSHDFIQDRSQLVNPQVCRFTVATIRTMLRGIGRYVLCDDIEWDAAFLGPAPRDDEHYLAQAINEIGRGGFNPGYVFDPSSKR
jgi:hypothetical protein